MKLIRACSNHATSSNIQPQFQDLPVSSPRAFTFSLSDILNFTYEVDCMLGYSCRMHAHYTDVIQKTRVCRPTVAGSEISMMQVKRITTTRHRPCRALLPV